MLPTVIEYTIQARRNRQPKVEPYKDERTPLDQLRSEILESLKRGEWVFDRSNPSRGDVRLNNITRDVAPIEYNRNISAYVWNGVTLHVEAHELIAKQASKEFAQSRIIEWRNAQPIKKDIDNAPKA